MHLIISFNIYHHSESECNQMSLIFIIWLRQNAYDCIIEHVDPNIYMLFQIKVSQYRCSHKNVAKLIKCLFHLAQSYKWVHLYTLYAIFQQLHQELCYLKVMMYKMLLEIDEFKKNLNFLIHLWSESRFDDVYSVQVHWNIFCKYNKF
jgi:hypothetical protein